MCRLWPTYMLYVSQDPKWKYLLIQEGGLWDFPFQLFAWSDSSTEDQGKFQALLSTIKYSSKIIFVNKIFLEYQRGRPRLQLRRSQTYCGGWRRGWYTGWSLICLLGTLSGLILLQKNKHFCTAETSLISLQKSCQYEGHERVVSAAVLDSKDLDLSSLPQEMAQLQSEGVNFLFESSVLSQ